ncbi:hypothetical protein [Mycobacterium sp. AZCC_0083]|uniref:hypothetical protein n=1 Tax=Mycobacterium sp. AZCC_0083 TaxID=2735882 RepID=UPI00160BA66E|nr:hypothetical protein [Mycobacterium sp. AZCC_0083]MBB5167111.1 hypothetical protein [Mycobacterium sp. AZCC_0083]
MSAIVRHVDDLALARRRLWLTRFTFSPMDGVHLTPPAVDYLIHPRTWREYRREILMRRSPYPPPPDLQIYGTPVLLSEQVGRDEVRLAVV